MGERKTAPPPPRPADHNFQVYAAFIGHQPKVVPPEPEPQLGLQWPAFKAFCTAAHHTWRRIGLHPIVSPAVRLRLMPLLAVARRRWLEAGDRLLRKSSTVARRATPRSEPPRRRRLNEIKATRTALRTPVKN